MRLFSDHPFSFNFSFLAITIRNVPAASQQLHGERRLIDDGNFIGKEEVMMSGRRLIVYIGTSYINPDTFRNFGG